MRFAPARIKSRSKATTLHLAPWTCGRCGNIAIPFRAWIFQQRSALHRLERRAQSPPIRSGRRCRRRIYLALNAPSIEGRCYNLVGDVRLSAREYLAELARVIERPLRFHPKSPYVLYG